MGYRFHFIQYGISLILTFQYGISLSLYTVWYMADIDVPVWDIAVIDVPGISLSLYTDGLIFMGYRRSNFF